MNKECKYIWLVLNQFNVGYGDGWVERVKTDSDSLGQIKT